MGLAMQPVIFMESRTLLWMHVGFMEWSKVTKVVEIARSLPPSYNTAAVAGVAMVED
jgi:hypothetical protein